MRQSPVVSPQSSPQQQRSSGAPQRTVTTHLYAAPVARLTTILSGLERARATFFGRGVIVVRRGFAAHATHANARAMRRTVRANLVRGRVPNDYNPGRDWLRRTRRGKCDDSEIDVHEIRVRVKIKC